MSAAEYQRRSSIVRLLLLLGAVAGALALVAARTDLVAGPARQGVGDATAGAGGAVVASLAAGTVIAAIAAAGRPLWLHLAGIVATTLIAFTAAAAVVGARASTTIEAGASIDLRAGGVLMVMALGLAVAATCGLLLALRRIARPEEGRERGARPEIGVAAKANAALGLGLLSLLVPLLSTLAVALGILANGDIRRSDNQLEGHGRAAGGIAAGIFVLAIVLAGGLLGVALVSPAD